MERESTTTDDHCRSFMMALEGNEAGMDRLRELDPLELERAACAALNLESSKVEEIVAIVEQLIGERGRAA